MGHVARLLEEAGIATVIVGIHAFQCRLKAMTLPRVLITSHLMGRTIGPVNDYDKQYLTVLSALELLDEATEAGTIINLYPTDTT